MSEWQRMTDEAVEADLREDNARLQRELEETKAALREGIEEIQRADWTLNEYGELHADTKAWIARARAALRESA